MPTLRQFHWAPFRLHLVDRFIDKPLAAGSAGSKLERQQGHVGVHLRAKRGFVSCIVKIVALEIPSFLKNVARFHVFDVGHARKRVYQKLSGAGILTITKARAGQYFLVVENIPRVWAIKKRNEFEEMSAQELRYCRQH